MSDNVRRRKNIPQETAENRRNPTEIGTYNDTSTTISAPTSSKPKIIDSLPIPLWTKYLVAVICFGFGLVAPTFLRHSGMLTTSMDIERDLHAASEAQYDSCSEDVLKDFWNAAATPGYHIICSKKLNDSQDLQKMTLYHRGLRTAKREVVLPISISWDDLKAAITKNLGIVRKENVQPWAIYSTKGIRLVEEPQEEVQTGQYSAGLLSQNDGVSLMFEGGQFVWPGVRIGYRRTVELYSLMPPGSPDLSDRHRLVTLETLSTVPLVISVTGFLSGNECTHIQELAEPTMKYSDVVLMDRDAGRPASDFRTSQTTFVRAMDDIMKDIDYRTASLVRLPVNHQEAVQVLRYGLNEKYNSHHDYFDPRQYQNDKRTMQTIQNGKRNRMITVFWYLSDVASGGETIFPRFNRSREQSTQDCDTGLKVKPETGKVIIFYSMTPDGVIDPYSLHGSCPVDEGTKWAANKWVWNAPWGS